MADEWKCSSCGAKIEVSGKRIVFCAYCGSPNSREKRALRSGMIECVQCGAENHKESAFCADCGSELYFACPKCGKLNPAESTHCTKCGVNIAQEIRNWQIKQAQEQQRRELENEKKRKRNRAIFVPVGILLCLFAVFFVIGMIMDNIQNEKDRENFIASRTATAETLINDAPFRWKSQDGIYEIILEPGVEVWTKQDFFTVDARFYNRGEQSCDIRKDQIYLVDDLGNTYKENSTGRENGSSETVEADSDRQIAAIFVQAISEGISRFTIHYPPFCGVPVDPIEIDLTSPWGQFGYNSY